ncbi:hypothetical protein DFH09DRAFT_1302793 [Mycena vulgaris]|nr:hypothetical protein DFH09DRAFT_1302793 [Mycena vulgaris]
MFEHSEAASRRLSPTAVLSTFGVPALSLDMLSSTSKLVIQGVLSGMPRCHSHISLLSYERADTVQFVKYFGKFRADLLALKAAVGVLALITHITSIQAL